MRLPTITRRRTLEVELPSLDELLRRRELGPTQISARGDGALIVGLAVGVVVGGAVVLALLPEPKARLAELRARLGGLDAPALYVEDARRLVLRAREVLAERIQLAKSEARQAREETKRELWTRFEIAKREGRQPES